MLYPFEKVLFIGPLDKQGGMGAVLRNYSYSIKDFNLITTHDGEQKVQWFYFLKQFLKIVKYIMLNDQLDILHIHSASRGSFFRKSIVLLTGKIFSKKVVFHIHGGGFYTFYSTNILNSFLVRWILKKADVVVCLSTEWKELFINEKFNQNVIHLNNPVIPFNYIKNIKNKEEIRLLFLGRITDEKGLFGLLDYLQSNKYFQHGKIKITIGGTGDIARLNHLIAVSNLQNRVNYVGWLGENEKRIYLQDSDVFILPSYYEGLPVSILEAMSAQMPIIATDIGGVPSIVVQGANGWLFKPGDFKSLDNVFDDIFTNRQLLSVYGQESLRMVQPFMSDRIMSDLSTIYYSI